MELPAILIGSLWAGLFASSLGVLFTAPARYIVPAFLCGFTGRWACDVLMGWGMSQNWSTAVAAALIVLVAVAVVRRHSAPPVVLVSSVLPLGAAGAMFKAIMDLMKISSLKGEALGQATVSFSANIAKAFTTSLAIAFGLAAGMAVVRLIEGEKAWEEV